MPISSDSLFHLTGTVNSFKGILTEGFRVSVSREDNQAVDPQVMKGKKVGDLQNLLVAIPMVCFCDIPLSQIRNHAAIYGNGESASGCFGFGLIKDWGIRCRLVPVTYTYETSPLLNNIQAVKEIIQAYTEKNPGAGEEDLISWLINGEVVTVYREINKCAHRSSYPRSYLYTKFYRGRYFRGKLVISDQKFENYSFYDEREWRFVPDYINEIPEYIYPFTETIASTYGITPEGEPELDLAYLKWFEQEEENLKDRVKGKNLTFSVDDITHLIVDRQADVDKMIEFIDKYPGDGILADELMSSQGKYKLVSKIISYEDLEANVFGG